MASKSTTLDFGKTSVKATSFDGPMSKAAVQSLTSFTDNSGGSATDTLAAITAGAAYAQADATAMKNAIASLSAKVNALIAALKT